MSHEDYLVGLVQWPGYMVGEDGSVWSYWKRGGGKGKGCFTIGNIPHQLKLQTFYVSHDFKRKHPYQKVNLCKSGKVYRVQVHQLVLEAFGKPCPPGMECRHRDGNGTNNWRYNLRWGTHRRNMKDRTRHGTDNTGSQNGNAKLTEKDIPVIRQLLASGISQTEVARRFKVSQQVISAIDLGKTWKHVP